MVLQSITPSQSLKQRLPVIHLISVLGNTDLLNVAHLAYFCSVKYPASIILKTYELAQPLKDRGIGVVSGFHSPVKQEVLVTLLRGDSPIVLCPARSIAKIRIPADWRPHIERGRMLIVSPFPESQTRATAQSAAIRNHVAAALTSQTFIAYAEPGGKTEAFALELIAKQVKVMTFDHEQTKNLRQTGAEVLHWPH